MLKRKSAYFQQGFRGIVPLIIGFIVVVGVAVSVILLYKPVSKSNERKDTETMIAQGDVCSVFVQESEEQFGGRPFLQHIMYLANDGTVQQTLERSDDTILSIREGKVEISEISELFQDLLAFEVPSPQGIKREQGEPIILSEYAEPSLTFEVDLCNKPPKQWIGSVKDAPLSIKNLADRIKIFVKATKIQSVNPRGRYIRSQLLLPAKAMELRGLTKVINISYKKLEDNPLLRRTITSSRRLIPLTSEKELYYSTPLAFKQGEVARIEYGQQVFQIWHIVSSKL